jgi:hypothetical protein
MLRLGRPVRACPHAVQAGFSNRPEVPTSPAAATGRQGWRMEREVAYTIGWLFVISGVLAVLVVSFLPRYGYRITTAGLLLGFVGLLIAGLTGAAVVVFVLTLARYGYYLYLRNKVRLVRSWR